MVELLLTELECQYLLGLARRTVRQNLGLETNALDRPDSANLRLNCGAFVSFYVDGDLRGCIGRMRSEEPVCDVIEEMALSASTSDNRFAPLALADMAQLQIEISVLSPLETVGPDDVVVGRDGIMLTRGLSRGVLLPQVATKYDWNRETFLAQTCRKAGLPSDAWQDSDVTIETFQAQVFSD